MEDSKANQKQGLLYHRDRMALGLSEMEMDRAVVPCPKMIRLHLALTTRVYPGEKQTIDQQESAVLKQWGDVSYGDTITRDVAVPHGISLHALHYVIQQCFGWQNSHLHNYELPLPVMDALTKKGCSDWMRLVGVLLRSPIMDENSEFWDDDYDGEDIKKWSRTKYSWPREDRCSGEKYLAARKDIEQIKTQSKDETYHVNWVKFRDELFVSDCYHASQKDYTSWRKPGEIVKTATLPFEALPYQGMTHLFDRNPNALLERLPLDSVLAPEGTTPIKGEDFLSEVEIPSRLSNPIIKPVTNTLLYNYDFGDDWWVAITASYDCADLVAQHRITQDDLDDAIRLYMKKGLPTCLAKDGYNLVDDVGGFHSYIEFLETINGPMNTDRKDMLQWASGMGWNRRVTKAKNIL